MAHQNLTGDTSRRAQLCANTTNGSLPLGTIIYTLEGALPVEYLCIGDRILTRAGMRILRDVTTSVDGFTLTFDTPATFYGDGEHIRAA